VSDSGLGVVLSIEEAGARKDSVMERPHERPGRQGGPADPEPDVRRAAVVTRASLSSVAKVEVVFTKKNRMVGVALHASTTPAGFRWVTRRCPLCHVAPRDQAGVVSSGRFRLDLSPHRSGTLTCQTTVRLAHLWCDRCSSHLTDGSCGCHASTCVSTRVTNPTPASAAYRAVS
jgi:hypothetical protein